MKRGQEDVRRWIVDYYVWQRHGRNVKLDEHD